MRLLYTELLFPGTKEHNVFSLNHCSETLLKFECKNKALMMEIEMLIYLVLLSIFIFE